MKSLEDAMSNRFIRGKDNKLIVNPDFQVPPPYSCGLCRDGQISGHIRNTIMLEDLIRALRINVYCSCEVGISRKAELTTRLKFEFGTTIPRGDKDVMRRQKVVNECWPDWMDHTDLVDSKKYSFQEWLKAFSRNDASAGIVAAITSHIKHGHMKMADGSEFDHILMTGSTGTGKSSGMAHLLRHYWTAGKVCLYADFSHIVTACASGHRREDETSTKQTQRMNQMMSGTISALAMDDVGSKVLSPTAEQMLYEIITYRYRSPYAPTFMTTNLTPVEFRGVVGERVWSRIADKFAIIEAVGPGIRSPATLATASGIVI